MKKIKFSDIILFAILCIFIVLYLILNNPNILFVLNVLIFVLIFIKSKLSIFSMKALLLIYVLLAVFFQYNTGVSYGILQYSTYPLHFDIMNLLVLLYNIIMFIFVCKTNVLSLENDKLLEKHNISKISTYICCIFAIVFSFVAFPDLTFSFSRSDRFESLLPGNAWNHVAIISLIMILPNFKKYLSVKITYLFCICWFLFHGERVDMIGLLFCSFLFFIKNKISSKEKINPIYYLKYLLLVFIVILLMIFIGEKREKPISNYSVSQLVMKVVVQNTAADIGYVYNTSILYKKNNDLLKGKTYLTYIQKIIPFIDTSNDAANLLQKNYSTPGGILILSEPYINFGVFGIIIFELLEMILIKYILKKKNSSYMFYLYLFIIATLFRTSWYGLEYIEKGIIFILPFIYILTKIIDDKVIKNGRKNINCSTNI